MPLTSRKALRDLVVSLACGLTALAVLVVPADSRSWSAATRATSARTPAVTATVSFRSLAGEVGRLGKAARIAAARRMPAPAPVTRVSTASGNRWVNISWGTAPGGRVRYYRVYRNGSLIVQTTSTSYADTGLVDGKAYRYAVTAYSPAGIPSSSSAAAVAVPSAAQGAPPMYWGAWIKNSLGEAPWSASALSAFERNAGKPVSIINWSSPFYSTKFCNGGYCQFWPNDFQTVRDHGAIPFFSWNPGPGTGAFTPAKIASGSQDAYITSWARDAKAWAHPFFLRFAWEMNGNWFPWGVGANGTTAATYVAMWRHVHDIFSRVGATNVTWVWCPNVDPQNQYAPLASLYPGDSYVDWTCLDGYNGNAPYLSFTSLFASGYDQITGSIAPSKPMIIGETASTESGGSKASWIGGMFSALPQRFPKIRGLLWFDKVDSGPGGHSDWPIESSPSAVAAFARGISAAQFRTSVFGAAGGSTIAPPT